MKDQFDGLHVTSDPFISNLSITFKRRKKKVFALPNDAANIAGLFNTNEEIILFLDDDDDDDDEVINEEEDSIVIAENEEKMNLETLINDKNNTILNFDENSEIYSNE